MPALEGGWALIVALAGLGVAGCEPGTPTSERPVETAPPISLSLPGPGDGRERVNVTLPRLSGLRPRTLPELCADPIPAAQPMPDSASPDDDDEPPDPNLPSTPTALRDVACALPPGRARADAFSTFALILFGTDRAQVLGRASAYLEAARQAADAEQAGSALRGIGDTLRSGGEVEGASELFGPAAEAFEAVAELCPRDDRACRRKLFRTVGGSFTESGRWRSDPAAMDQAVAFLIRARDLTDGEDGEDRVSILNALGNAYGYSSELHGAPRRLADLQRSADAYEALLPLLDAGPRDERWAMVRHNLGTAYDALSRTEPSDRAARIDQAIAAFEASLTVWTRGENATDWAAAHENLSGSLFRRGRETGDTAQVHRGIRLGRDALSVRAELKSSEPLHWAYSAHRLAAHLVDRAEAGITDPEPPVPVPGVPVQPAPSESGPARDRAEASVLLDAVEPILVRAGAMNYLETVRRLRARIASGSNASIPGSR